MSKNESRYSQRGRCNAHRTQPSWLLECIKVGIPLAQLPPTPAADASFKEKSQHTWELRKAWEHKTGRQIERLTPPGYYDKIIERRRLANEGPLGAEQRHRPDHG